MRIVALCGCGESGKTETLKLFIRRCYRNGATKLASQPHPYSVKKDEIAVFSYSGKIVCVSTYGDDASGIDKGYQVALKQKCDVFVTAARGRLNCLSLGEVCKIARGYKSYPILLSAYWEKDLNDRQMAMRARVDALSHCI